MEWAMQNLIPAGSKKSDIQVIEIIASAGQKEKKEKVQQKRLYRSTKAMQSDTIRHRWG
jgi:hypothetical protein